ncbi:hypothetical protein [Uliginosibacterium gangwonense]|uniref:hypothetical protein n=1 Tax=Uliginosibacterium gangwonense TaxID=392736 RepID=UPI000375B7FA|nr:hypothetical protein [Uliginosibacterium gangwonense]
MPIPTIAAADLPWFKVKFLRYGYTTKGLFHPARWVTWNVQAHNEDQAIKTARTRYRRAEQFSIVKPKVDTLKNT